MTYHMGIPIALWTEKQTRLKTLPILLQYYKVQDIRIFYRWTCVVVLTTINYELLTRSTNRYIIVPAGAAFDILAYATSMLCLYKFGRRLPLTIALVVTGITLQCTAPAPLGNITSFCRQLRRRREAN